MGLFGGLGKILGGAARLGVGGLIPANSLNAAQQQGQANTLSQEAVDFARQDIERRQPFRDQLFASLQQGQPQRQDLSNLFGSANPFAKSLGPLNPQAQQAAAPVAPPALNPFPRGRRTFRGGGGGSGGGRDTRFIEEDAFSRQDNRGEDF
jgi:hypothetical protein